jgi:hypothetical protein
VDLASNQSPVFDEKKLYKLTFVEPHEVYVASTRKAAAAKKLLICVDFKSKGQPSTNGQFSIKIFIVASHLFCFHSAQDEFLVFEEYDPTTFYYSVGEEELIKISKDNVCVACMEYVPAIGSLVAGYNFGGFQIWRVDNITLEYDEIYSDFII